MLKIIIKKMNFNNKINKLYKNKKIIVKKIKIPKKMLKKSK